MSEVTNLIIATALSENVEYLKSKFRDFKLNKIPFNIVSVETESLPKTWYGGSKFLEVNLFIGAYNYLDLNALIVFMRSNIAWESPESVQLIVKGQHDEKFKIIDLVQ
jgi:hypothetical protein